MNSWLPATDDIHHMPYVGSVALDQTNASSVQRATLSADKSFLPNFADKSTMLLWVRITAYYPACKVLNVHLYHIDMQF